MFNQKVTITAFGGSDVIQVVTDHNLPEPSHNEVRVRMEASSAVFTDTLIRRGLYPYLNNEPPFVLGYDLVGRIDQLGEGVHHWQVGDRVADLTQFGSNADFVLRPADRLLPVPADVDAAEAVSLLLSYMTAYQMLHRLATLHPGQQVLIHGGSGAVGTALIQLSQARGLHVVATSSASKLELLRHHGARAVDRASPNFWEQVAAEAPEGYDAVFDGVSLPNFIGSYDLLKSGGTLVVFGAVGAAQGLERRTADTTAYMPFMFSLIGQALAIWNSLPGNRRAHFYDVSTTRKEHPEWYAEDLSQLFEMLKAGTIKPVIDERFTLSEARRAHQKIDAGEVQGRLVFVTEE